VSIKITGATAAGAGQIARIVRYVIAVHNALLLRDPTVSEIDQYANSVFTGGSPMDIFDQVNASEERQSQAVLFVVPGHYYSPIANPKELAEHVSRLPEAGPELPGIALDRAALVATWDDLLPYMMSCPFPLKRADGYRFFFDNNFFGIGDGLILHALLRKYRPKRYVEIGCGFSSACALDTIDGYLPGACQATFVEPHPERLRAAIGERGSVRVLDVPVQTVGLELFAELEAGDILFIDSSHVLRTGSDVAFELFEILPRLAPGVLVHFHDISWPFEYPVPWIMEENRSWNEAYALRALLTSNDDWKILVFNDYFSKFEAARVTQAFPAFHGELGASLWLERR
jgi:predicted O-methyltransferase YrrM